MFSIETFIKLICKIHKEWVAAITTEIHLTAAKRVISHWESTKITGASIFCCYQKCSQVYANIMNITANSNHPCLLHTFCFKTCQSQVSLLTSLHLHKKHTQLSAYDTVWIYLCIFATKNAREAKYTNVLRYKNGYDILQMVTKPVAYP